MSSRDSSFASIHGGRRYRLQPRHWCMVRLVAMPSVISTCVLMQRTHILVGLGGMGREHMQQRTVGIFFSGSAASGAAKPSVGASSILLVDLISGPVPRVWLAQGTTGPKTTIAELSCRFSWGCQARLPSASTASECFRAVVCGALVLVPWCCCASNTGGYYRIIPGLHRSGDAD